MALLAPWCGASAATGDLIATFTGHTQGAEIRSVSLDTNNNIIVGLQLNSGEWMVEAYEGIDHVKTVDDSIREFMESKHALQLPGFVLIMLIPWMMGVFAFGYGCVFGFRFFTARKNG